MPLTILQGPAGSGKTHHCLEQLRRAQRERAQGSVLLLVPAQSSYTMRGALPTDAQPVVLGRPILTFDARSAHGSLAGWLLRDGADLWARKVGPTEQLLILRRLLRVSPPESLALSARTLGFSLELLELFREWKEALLTPEDLEKAFPPPGGDPGAPSAGALSAAAAGPPEAAPGARLDFAKQRDLQSLYRRYQEALEVDKRLDLEDVQREALKQLSRSPQQVASMHFLVDLFSHFTNWQMEILGLLARHAASVTVTLAYEEDRPWVYSHLENDRRRLTALLPGGATIRALGEQRRLQSPVLRALERELFRERPDAIENDGVSVQCVEAEDPVAELEWMARRIRLLARDEGFAYEDIAVLFRSLAPSQRRVEEIFRASGVPVFVDERQEQMHTAPARAVRQVLRLFSPRAPLEDLLALFRNPLAPDLLEEADRIELRARRDGVTRAAELLEYAQGKLGDGSPLVEAARGISRLTENREPRPPLAWVDALREGLRVIGAEEACRRDPALYLRHRPAWDSLETLLNHVARESAAPVRVEEFDADLTEILAAGRGEEVPRVAGCVLIGDVFQSRLPEVRALFLPGLTEGGFPARPSENPLLPDADRSRIHEATGKPMPLSEAQADEEYFLFYVAVTRASERLYLSRPLMDRSGRETGASHFQRETLRVIRGLKPVRVDLHGIGFREAVDLLELDERLALALSRPAETPAEVHEVTTLVNRRIEMRNRSPWATTPRPGRIGGLRKAVVEVAATRLEAFAQCPFRYFAQQVLKVEDPRELAFGPREDGTLLDDVARIYLAECRAGGGLAAVRSREAAAERLLGILEEQIDTRHGEARKRPLWRARIEMLRGAVRRFAAALWAQAQEGEWEPEFLQLSFGGTGGASPDWDPASTHKPLRLEGKGFELRVEGRADRVDRRVAEPAEVRVMDYKRRKTPGVGQKLVDGRVLQVGLYRLALEQLYRRRATEAAHFGFREAGWQWLDPNLASALKGTPEADLSPAQFTRLKALELAGRMAAGDAAVEPAEGECDRCVYSAACRIDHWQRLLEVDGGGEGGGEGGGDAG